MNFEFECLVDVYDSDENVLHKYRYTKLPDIELPGSP